METAKTEKGSPKSISETEAEFKGIGIRDRALLFKLVFNLRKVTNILGKLYQKQPEATQKAIAIIVATILLKPYDSSEELFSALESIKKELSKRLNMN